MLDPRELLESIMIDFGLDPGNRSKPMMVRDLSQYLVDQRLAGRLVLLVIDEAQNLGLGALEELRMLSNLETEKSKLLQIVLVGQPNLRDKLAAPELEQLRQRITVSYHLPPLDAEETFNYINHRLRHAAVSAPLVFPRQATDLIHARSGGVPRIINVICDAALVFGYAEERHAFDARVILEVLDELETTGILPAPAPLAAARHDAPAPVPPPAMKAPEPAPAPMAAQTLAPPAPAPFVPAQPQPGPAIPLPASDSWTAPALEPVAVATSGTDFVAVEEARLELDRRERVVEQREAELAEQRRVLAEEYRLLRAQRAAASSAATEGAFRFQVAGSAPTSFERLVGARFDREPGGSFWTRLKRFMLGVSPS
jgi:hypothetical protein